MDHEHSHEHHTSSEPSFEEKLIRILRHWIKHNEDHVRNYREWAGQAREHHFVEAATQLGEVVALTEASTEKLLHGLESLERLQE